MALPDSVMRHHTAWIHCADCRPHPVRYAVDADRLVCFGDDLPAGATNGRQLFVTVHEIAGGQALAEMNLTLRDVAATTSIRTQYSTCSNTSRSAAPPKKSMPRSPGTETAVSSRCPVDDDLSPLPSPPRTE
jgi:hypothetical protein